MGPKLVGFGANSVEIVETMVEISPSSFEFGPSLANIGKTRPRSVQMLVEVWPSRSNLAHIGQIRPTPDQSWPMSAPKSGQHRPFLLDEIEGSAGNIWPELVEGSPNLGEVDDIPGELQLLRTCQEHKRHQHTSN